MAYLKFFKNKMEATSFYTKSFIRNICVPTGSNIVFPYEEGKWLIKQQIFIFKKKVAGNNKLYMDYFTIAISFIAFFI